MSKLNPVGGFRMTPKPPSNSTQSVYAVGTAYQLTNTQAKLDFGTTDPVLVLTSPGTYLLLARVRTDYNAATFAAVRTVTFKLRRTNNTAADLLGAATSLLTSIITALTYTAGTLLIPPVIYTTSNSNDSIEIFGAVDTVPTAGTIDATEAEIIAIRLS